MITTHFLSFVWAAMLVCVFAGNATFAGSKKTQWQGVWVMQGLECPTADQLHAIENGVFEQGPHWQFFTGAYCEALHGAQNGSKNQITVRGMCRSTGVLETREWTFEPKTDGTAQVSGLSAEPVTMKHCPRNS